MTNQPHAAEPVQVQLTRIEGTVNLIAYQMAEVKADITDLRGEVAAAKERIAAVEINQAQSSGASASWKTWLPIILAALAVALSVVLSLGG